MAAHSPVQLLDYVTVSLAVVRMGPCSAGAVGPTREDWPRHAGVGCCPVAALTLRLRLLRCSRSRPAGPGRSVSPGDTCWLLAVQYPASTKKSGVLGRVRCIPRRNRCNHGPESFGNGTQYPVLFSVSRGTMRCWPASLDRRGRTVRIARTCSRCRRCRCPATLTGPRQRRSAHPRARVQGGESQNRCHTTRSRVRVGESTMRCWTAS